MFQNVARCITFFTRMFKWLELQLFLQITPFLQRQGTRLAQKIGVVYHFSEEGDIYSPEKWTAEQEAAALAKCCDPKFTSLIHFQIEDKREYFARHANSWSLGCGETFMEGVWSCPQGDEHLSLFFKRFLEADLLRYYLHPLNRLINYLDFLLPNLQTRNKSAELIDTHYDLGNDLYELMLDPWMQYTCGYWAKANNLNDSQLEKMELIAKKLDLSPGMRVLDIGCGWGMLCKYLAERHGVECVGVTISEEQLDYARAKCKGLKVEIRLQDYRDVNEKFDRMVVAGMLEHVGFRNYNEFFKIAARNLKEDGILLVHTIGVNHANVVRTEPWLHTYIFPNSNLPYPNDITQATLGKFIIEDWHNFGPDYVKTLRAWRDNFKCNWPKIQGKYGQRFYRMWIFYLSMSAGIFQSRRTQLWQIVLSKEGLQTDYRAAR